MRLLLVEDEEKTSSYVSRALSELGFTVDIAGDGIDGLHLAVQQEYDAVILDVMLPGKDGYSVLEGLRAIKQTPVLMLSARGSVDERVRGLRQGADDYLPKPFSLIELVARIQALLRRRSVDGIDVSQLQIDDLHVDLLSRKVNRNGDRIDLTAKEFALLSLLARHQGEILSKMMIAEQVWDMNFDSDANVVEVAIKRLRNKIDAPYQVKLLHTVRGMGYVLETRHSHEQARSPGHLR
ncbi:heavy metal response regulator transcription factor [Klebsiella pneumoniae]|uniref:heavy metal response regulator transcription factor n=1 Tax=Enterobacteriaceae TaxID=543 RepID=UPI00115C149D|nr:heavy metal response regulator transcription factor [Klebsiella pneumoniae]ELY2785152.1 heavy metal response regulator transcription factor [Cronobacter turicensis]ELA0994046.1 heavy metal response regulator transcription factor [Klebsiella pneumoniae]MCU8675166.1 heavy metal response regulator transcription factor [Klebsiella pneumoniae]MCU8688525.1 heavy metal response regulator transcription factor [Klebsiella pneumoniae]HBR3463625.1 heavy metal response regulator transcription factor [K